MRVHILSYVAVALLLLTKSAVASVPAIALQVEENVHSLANDAEALHSQRCSLLSSCTEDCTQPACAKKWDEDPLGFECNTKFGKSYPVEKSEAVGPLVFCLDQIRGLNRSVVRLPTTSHNTKATEEFVCASRKLDTTMAAQEASGNLTSWQYVAHSDGGIRLFPGAPQDNGAGCSYYDARQRPWYLAASNGPRDVIILLSTSNNTNGEKMVLGKCVADTLLQSLGQNDYVDLITYNKGTTSLGGDALGQATPDRVKSLRDKLAATNAETSDTSGHTSFKFAYSVAFSELFSSPTSSNCQKVIIQLTDGYDSEAYHWSFLGGKRHDSNIIVNHIKDLRTQYSATGNKKVSIFTFGIKLQPHLYDDHLNYRNNLIAIACDNNGAFGPVEDRNNPMNALAAFFRILSVGINGDSTVRWTSNYTDAFGMGDLVTASQPLWDRTTTVPTLVGVVGIDVPTSRFGDTRSAALSALEERSSFCPDFSTLTNCQLQVVRRESWGGWTCPAPYPTYESCKAANKMTPENCAASSLTGTSSRFCVPGGSESLSTADYTCCGMGKCGGDAVPEPNTTLIVAGVIGGIVGIVMATLCCGGRARQCCQRRTAPAAKEDTPFTSAGARSGLGPDLMTNLMEAQPDDGDMMLPTDPWNQGKGLEIEMSGNI